MLMKYNDIRDDIHITKDIDTLTQQGMAIQQTDMIIASYSRIAEYINEANQNAKNTDKYWRVTELAKNASGETIGMKIYYMDEKPGWVTDSLSEWIMS